MLSGVGVGGAPLLTCVDVPRRRWKGGGRLPSHSPLVPLFGPSCPFFSPPLPPPSPPFACQDARHPAGGLAFKSGGRRKTPGQGLLVVRALVDGGGCRVTRAPARPPARRPARPPARAADGRAGGWAGWLACGLVGARTEVQCQWWIKRGVERRLSTHLGAPWGGAGEEPTAGEVGRCFCGRPCECGHQARGSTRYLCWNFMP